MGDNVRTCVINGIKTSCLETCVSMRNKYKLPRNMFVNEE